MRYPSTAWHDLLHKAHNDACFDRWHHRTQRKLDWLLLCLISQRLDGGGSDMNERRHDDCRGNGKKEGEDERCDRSNFCFLNSRNISLITDKSEVVIVRRDITSSRRKTSPDTWCERLVSLGTTSGAEMSLFSAFYHKHTYSVVVYLHYVSIPSHSPSLHIFMSQQNLQPKILLTAAYVQYLLIF